LIFQNSFGAFLKQPLCCPKFSQSSKSTQNASANLKCVTLRFVNNVNMIETSLWSIIISGIWKSMMTPTYSTMNLVIVWNINVVVNSFSLVILLLVRDPIIWYQPYLFRSCSRQALFTRSVIRHSCDLVTCLQAMSMQYHQEGPEDIFPSSGWTNPTLDPFSTNTFRVPKSKFIINLLWCDIWYHQSTLPVSVINMISWSKD
jgi:hypothetical protein